MANGELKNNGIWSTTNSLHRIHRETHWPEKCVSLRPQEKQKEVNLLHFFFFLPWLERLFVSLPLSSIYVSLSASHKATVSCWPRMMEILSRQRWNKSRGYYSFFELPRESVREHVIDPWRNAQPSKRTESEGNFRLRTVPLFFIRSAITFNMPLWYSCITNKKL